MASYIDPEEFLGSVDGLIQFIADHNEPLTLKGLNTGTISAGLQSIRGDVFAKKTSRDNKKTQLTNAQRAFEGSAASNYTAFSDAVDIIAGSVGKKTPEGKQVLNLRKNVTGSNKTGGGSSSSTSGGGGSSSSSSSSSVGGGSSSSSSTAGSSSSSSS